MEIYFLPDDIIEVDLVVQPFQDQDTDQVQDASDSAPVEFTLFVENFPLTISHVCYKPSSTLSLLHENPERYKMAYNATLKGRPDLRVYDASAFAVFLMFPNEPILGVTQMELGELISQRMQIEKKAVASKKTNLVFDRAIALMPALKHSIMLEHAFPLIDYARSPVRVQNYFQLKQSRYRVPDYREPRVVPVFLLPYVLRTITESWVAITRELKEIFSDIYHRNMLSPCDNACYLQFFANIARMERDWRISFDQESDVSALKRLKAENTELRSLLLLEKKKVAELMLRTNHSPADTPPLGQ